MLLDKIDDASIARLEGFNRGAKDFSPDDYNLFFRYDTAAGTMLYLAVRKETADESLPFAHCFSMGADLKATQVGDFPWFPLLAYLREYEKGLSAEEQKQLYGDAYYTLGSVVGLSKRELGEREKARRAFLSFLDGLEGKGLLDEQGQEKKTLRLSVQLQKLAGKTETLDFRLKLGQTGGRMVEVPDAGLFCQALKTGQELTIRPKFTVHLSEDAFEESLQPLIRHFLDHVSAGGSTANAKDFRVSGDHILPFFSLLPREGAEGVLCSEEGNWTITQEEEPASVQLDSAGTLILMPHIAPLKEGKAFAVSGKRMVVLDAKTKEASLYRFEDVMSAELFQYFTGRPQKEVSYVSDLFVQKILPASTDLIRKSERNVFRITVHVSLEEETLVFQTQYWIGEEKKAPSFFEGKPFEQALIRSCAYALESLHAVVNGRVTAQEDILFFLKSDLGPLRNVAEVYLDEKLKRLKIRKAPAVEVRAGRAGGWLNLTFHSDEYTEEELEAIFAAYRKKKTFFLLKGNLILLEPETLEPVESVIEGAGAEKSLSDVQLPFYHVMLLEGYREDGADISMDEMVTDAVTGVVGYKEASVELEEGLQKIMRPYQLDGVRWMKRLSQYGFSGILADDMGLGKTLQVLAFLSASDFDQPVLIVCPKSLVYNWRNEIRKWLGDVPVVIIAGTKGVRGELIASIPEKGRSFYITGYDSLRADIDAYEGKNFFLVLADEAQNIKNASTQKAKAIRQIGSRMRMALTGTPVENSLTDLWSIFDFLMPGYLGTKADFRKKYELEADQAGARMVLARKASPFLLRRSKEEVLDFLPGKEVVLVTVSMADEQRRLYEAYLHKARKLSQTEKGVSIFSALTQLRQICVDPSVFLEDYEETSAKLSVALDQVVTSIEGGHRVLVFSSFTRVLEHFRYFLEEKEIRSYYINGDTPGAMRVEMAEKFNKEDRVKVMLVSIKAGGTGLNLVGADTVIHLDPWWNFAVEEQATDRAYRIGQTKPVTVYKLIAHDSIEEKIIALQEQKREASNDVVQTSLSGIDSFTAEDIKYILE